MAESQSRYGIMEELNNRKINEKEKLANIERETDNHIYDVEKKIAALKSAIETEEKGYKPRYLDSKREKTLRLKMLQGEFERQKTALEAEILEDSKTYEPTFQKWKATGLEMIKTETENLERYSKQQTAKIAEKKAIIDEIEAGINSLKEMSKEQGAKE